MPKYAKVGNPMLNTLSLGGNAFDEAVANYAKYSGLNFWNDLVYYLRTGFVVSRPSCFAMGRPIERDGKRGWFIQIAVGNIGELITCFPCKLDFVAFCRNNDENMRVIDFDTYVKKVAALYGYTDAN